MRLPAVAFLLLALTAQDADAAAGRYRLALPRAVHAGDRVLLQVTLGAVPKGTEVIVYGATGELLGSASPFGRNTAGTYQVPVPKGTRDVRRVVRRFGTPPHAPSAREVTAVTLVVR